jgi:hypothetical protein
LKRLSELADWGCKLDPEKATRSEFDLCDRCRTGPAKASDARISLAPSERKNREIIHK